MSLKDKIRIYNSLLWMLVWMFTISLISGLFTYCYATDFTLSDINSPLTVGVFCMIGMGVVTWLLKSSIQRNMDDHDRRMEKLEEEIKTLKERELEKLNSELERLRNKKQ